MTDEPSGLIVRQARLADAAAMARVMDASIRQLCDADHGGRADLIAGWTANKTPEEVARSLTAGWSRYLVAEIDGQVAAVGAVALAAGEVVLNYVSPGHRFRGVSTTLLARLEAELAAAGVAQMRLTSTVTAHGFYLRRGWLDDGPLDRSGRMPGYPMRKPVAPPHGGA